MVGSTGSRAIGELAGDVRAESLKLAPLLERVGFPLTLIRDLVKRMAYFMAQVSGVAEANHQRAKLHRKSFQLRSHAR
jgi:hypothetical protein